METRRATGHERPTGFVRVCQVAEIPVGGLVSVTIGDTPVALVRSGDGVYAVRDLCSHAEVSFSDGGEVNGTTIECWLHGSCFDLRTGEPTSPPATEPVATYRVRIEDGDVYVSDGPDARRAAE